MFSYYNTLRNYILFCSKHGHIRRRKEQISLSPPQIYDDIYHQQHPNVSLLSLLLRRNPFVIPWINHNLTTTISNSLLYHHHHGRCQFHHHHHYSIDQITMNNNHISTLWNYIQKRYKGRNDGNRYEYMIRKTTKKQRKEYHRHKQKIEYMKYTKHGKPGSKAGLRRQYEYEQTQQLIVEGKKYQQLQQRGDNTSTTKELQLLSSSSNHTKQQTYTWDDALLDDLMGNHTMITKTPEPSYLGHQHRFYYNAVVDQMDDYYHFIHNNQQQPPSSSSSSKMKVDIMNDSSVSESMIVHDNTHNHVNGDTLSSLNTVDLPSDEMISKALRAYRDKHGTRHRNPIGIIKALQHILHDMQVPIHAIGEYTYTTLLTCCRTPIEGRRIIQMMKEQRHPISIYSWSILCDLYAKTGDYQNCIKVQQEMLEYGISPTMTSYTSLLAACYKICIDGRVSHTIRAQAARVGWEKWQEMRIIGIEADAMAYGAIIRLKAASGKAEECINLLDEMVRFKVYPTTLCYTSALRAVARSHSIAIRYEKGSSRRNRRREMITQHHGKLTRQILISAENAGVDKDDGFISALCLCAASAGDVASAKAIYIANEIIKTQHNTLRTIGSNQHLARLRGEQVYSDDPNLIPIEYNRNQKKQQQIGGSTTTSDNFSEIDLDYSRRSLIETSDYQSKSMSNEWNTSTKSISTSFSKQRYIPSFGEREYGKDSRVLSSILHACAQAVDPSGIGTMWQGRENNGYFCINSLRLIAQPKLPQHSDDRIPGQGLTDTLVLKNDHRDGYREGKRQSRKFNDVDSDKDIASNFEELLDNPKVAKRYVDSDGRRKEEYRRSTPEDIWRMKYGDDDWTETTAKANTNNSEDEILKLEQLWMSENGLDKSNDSDDDDDDDDSDIDFDLDEDPLVAALKSEISRTNSKAKSDEIYFDDSIMRWRPVSERVMSSKPTQNTTRNEITVLAADRDTSKLTESNNKDGTGEASKDIYFDYDTMRWKPKENGPLDVGDESNKNLVNDGNISNDRVITANGYVEKVSAVLHSEIVIKSDETTGTEHQGVQNSMITNSGVVQTESTIRSLANPAFESVKPIDGIQKDEMKVTTTLHSKEEAEDNEEAFKIFFSDLLKESHESGQGDVTEEEARELFDLMKDEYNEMIAMTPEDLGLDNVSDVPPLKPISDSDQEKENPNSPSQSSASSRAVEPVQRNIKSSQNLHTIQSDTTVIEYDLQRNTVSNSPIIQQDQKASIPTSSDSKVRTMQFEPENSMQSSVPSITEGMKNDISMPVSNQVSSGQIESYELQLDSNEVEKDYRLERLRELLPTFSDQRLEMIVQAYEKSLGDPSLLELIPIVRENMPDYITSTWLKQMSSLTAQFVIQKAAQEEIINTEILNAALELYTSAGSLDRAIEFHQTEFENHNLEPTVYSDRLVLQMLLRNSRFNRALSFKQHVERGGRSLDLKAYGSLIEYCSRRGQLGSALLLLKECLSVHEAPPGESSLSNLRISCRQAGIEEEVGIENMIGKDPMEWLRHGERELKREYSKKGRRDVQLSRNVSLRI